MPSVRRMKERYILTETRKQANRMTFGKVRLLPNIFAVPLLTIGTDRGGHYPGGDGILHRAAQRGHGPRASHAAETEEDWLD